MGLFRVPAAGAMRTTAAGHAINARAKISGAQISISPPRRNAVRGRTGMRTHSIRFGAPGFAIGVLGVVSPVARWQHSFLQVPPLTTEGNLFPGSPLPGTGLCVCLHWVLYYVMH